MRTIVVPPTMITTDCSSMPSPTATMAVSAAMAQSVLSTSGLTGGSVSGLVNSQEQLYRTEYLLHRPLFLETLSNSAPINAGSTAPVSHAHRFTLMSYKHARAFVVQLLTPTSPSAIFGRVWPVVVDSIQRFTAWPRTHIGIERFKRFAPTVTHLDSASAIPLVSAMTWIVAAAFRAAPNLIFSALGHSVCGDVCSVDTAPAAFRFSVEQQLSNDRLQGAAFTPAHPLNSLMVGIVCSVQYGPSSELPSSQIMLRFPRHQVILQEFA